MSSCCWFCCCWQLQYCRSITVPYYRITSHSNVYRTHRHTKMAARGTAMWDTVIEQQCDRTVITVPTIEPTSIDRKASAKLLHIYRRNLLLTIKQIFPIRWISYCGIFALRITSCQSKANIIKPQIAPKYIFK